jgi:tRNA(Ile)-lysidine synthase TilS/MesJ
LGIQGDIAYSDQSLARIREFAAANVPAAKLHIVDIEETFGKTIPQISRERMRGHGKPCSACGLSKRYVMNRLAAARGYDVLATGHNLDDEAAVLMQNTLHWQTAYLADRLSRPPGAGAAGKRGTGEKGQTLLSLL